MIIQNDGSIKFKNEGELQRVWGVGQPLVRRAGGVVA